MLQYRAYFEVPDRQSVLETSLREFHEWLVSKGYDADALAVAETVGAAVAPHAEGSIVRIRAGDGSSTCRAQLVERKKDGAWTSDLVIHVPAGKDEPAAVLLDIHSAEVDESRPISMAVPRLARGLLGTLSARDSLAHLSDQPVLIGAHEVEALAAAVCDVNRRGLIFVAGSSDALPLKAWSKYVSSLVRQTTGLGSTYVMDASATEALASLLGPRHAVVPGTLRTYQPGVDTGSELDARRHRYLSTSRILNDRSQWLAAILGRRARENALEAELPPRIQAALDQIAARADEILVGTASSATSLERPAPAPTQVEQSPTAGPIQAADRAARGDAAAFDATTTSAQPDVEAAVASGLSATDESYLAAAAVIQEVLGVCNPSPGDWAALGALARAGRQAARNQAEVASRIEDLRIEIGQVGQDRRLLGRRLEDEQLEHAATYASLTEAESELRRLRSLLMQTEQASAVYIAPETRACLQCLRAVVGQSC